jgi:ATP:ADP antiporter, AAA family
MEEKQPFGKWRQTLWPVHRFELKKLLPLFFLKFFISFNYAILTCLKDTFIVTEKGSGAEVIPVLKGWVVLPIALIVTLIYAKLSNHFKRSTLFYAIIIFFMAFVLVYSFFLYPNREALSPHKSAEWLLGMIGNKYEHWVAIYRNWMQALFFVVAELWGGVVIFLLFWGFTNQISQMGEAKRYYTLFIAAGDLASFATGPLVGYYAYKYAHTEFTFTLQWLALYVVLFGILIMGFHWWMMKYVLTDKRFYDPEKMGQPNLKTKLSLWNGIKFIASSKYLRALAVMVIGYGLALNLVEVSWKAHLKMLYPNPSDYQAFTGTVTSMVGLFSLIAAVLLGGGVIRRFGWHFSAQITPIVVGCTGLVFLALILMKGSLGSFTTYFGVAPLIIIVFFGAFQNVLSKVVKYTFFDPTKEMAFIPLDQESKVKGKAAIDVVGSRLGKSGSAWIQLALIDLAGTGSVLSITHFIFPFIACTTFFWILSTRTVNRGLAEKDKKNLQTELS